MKCVGYYDGALGPLEEMSVPMGDRALYFGDGCYEAACVANGVIFALEDHLDRLYNSLRLMEIPFTMERQVLIRELYKVVDAAEPSPIQFLYWQISRGNAPRVHSFPSADVKPGLMITVKPYALQPMDVLYRLITMEDKRFYFCNIKTLNLFPSVMAAQRAAQAGCNEVVLHRGSRVTEGSHSNILMLSGGVLRTAPTDELILPGITRKHLLALARENGIPTDERPFSLVELMNADEIIVTSSTALCMQVCTIDGIPVGGKDPARLSLLQNTYLDKLHKETQSR